MRPEIGEIKMPQNKVARQKREIKMPRKKTFKTHLWKSNATKMYFLCFAFLEHIFEPESFSGVFNTFANQRCVKKIKMYFSLY